MRGSQASGLRESSTTRSPGLAIRGVGVLGNRCGGGNNLRTLHRVLAVLVCFFSSFPSQGLKTVSFVPSMSRILLGAMDSWRGKNEITCIDSSIQQKLIECLPYPRYGGSA